jgi:hypothetical protein
MSRVQVAIPTSSNPKYARSSRRSDWLRSAAPSTPKARWPLDMAPLCVRYREPDLTEAQDRRAAAILAKPATARRSDDNSGWIGR